MEKDEKYDDSNQDSSNESVAEQQRPSWDNKIQYIMAALGFAVGLGNIWRFPYLCKKNGGGAFLIPYVIMLFVEGYPLYYLELAVGQKIRKGSIGVWTHINPHLGGVGIASNIVSLLIGLYYNMILGWALFYFYNSFQSPLPWASCPIRNNSQLVLECNMSSPTTYFWYRSTLDISSSIDNGSDLNWRMVLVLFVAWFFIFFGMIKGIKSSGKVMYFATSFPYVVLIAFFFRAMFLDGAADGVAYMFSPHWSHLKRPEVWRDAATQIFFSLGLGYGSIIAYSSYNPPKNNCYKDAIFIATANCLTSIFASIIVFAVLGFKAKVNFLACEARQQNILAESINNFSSSINSSSFLNFTETCSVTKELDTNVQGTGLAFIAFTEAILMFPGAPFWSVLFFFMILNIGMSSEFGILQTVVTTVLDSGIKISKTVLSAALCICMFLFGLIFTQRSGSYFLDIFDSYSATISLLSVALCEVIGVSYVYGIRRFIKDLEDMIGSKPNMYFVISWLVTCPLALLIILGASFYSLFAKAPKYGAWIPELAAKVETNYSTWAYVLIVMLVLLAASCIPITALCRRLNFCRPENWVSYRTNATTTEKQEVVNYAVTESTQPLTASV